MNPQYLATMTDAEGSITIVRREFSRREAYSLRVLIYNTNRELLETIKSHFGGLVTPARKETKKHAASYVLVWTHKNAAAIVGLIEPLLIVKSKQAKVALKFQELASSLNPGQAGIPEAALVRLREFKNEINRLNLKGPQKYKNGG